MLDLDPDPLRELSDALLGRVLPGSEGRQYPLRERIGEGGQGWVFRAAWSADVDVVVKVLRPDAATRDALARFQREAEVLRMLSRQPSINPHVVRFHDHGVAHVELAAGRSWDVPFTVLELVDGETLEQAIARAQPGGLGLERARRILRHVVLALQAVHACNVVHRDLKPSNVLLATVAGGEIAKVTDFGLAKLLDPDLQRTTHLAGATVGYAPPEQFEDGNRRVGRATDVFSLAAIFYELVTGLPAFPFHPNAHPLLVVLRILTEARPAFARVAAHLPPELGARPDVVAAVDVELARALSPDPAERHATVTELHEGLERALSGLGSSTSLPSSRGSGPLPWPSAPPSDSAPVSMAPPSSVDATVLMEDAVDEGMRSTRPMIAFVPASARDVSAASSLAWQRITAPTAPEAFRAIAIAPAGARAIGLGPRGPAQWRRGHWSPFDLPGVVDRDALRCAAWAERLLVAGVGAAVVGLDDRLAPTIWRLDLPGTVVHAVSVDASGVLLAGEAPASGGRVGFLAQLPSGATGRAGVRSRLVPGCGPLRSVIRLGSGVLACGDEGALVSLEEGAPPRIAHVCEPRLSALIAVGDGTATAVGAGGFVFRVWRSLEVRLESVQTTRDLLAVAQGPGGMLWCAGAAGRVLRREGQGWIRVGIRGAEGRVRALHASGHRVLAFCDDGAVYEGVSR